MLGFTSVSPVWIDVSARQRQLGRTLRTQLETIVSETIPDYMLDLLRKADARFAAATGCEVHFSSSAPRLYSINIAVAIVAMLIIGWAAYDVAWLAFSRPEITATVAFFTAVAATISATAWLIEGK